MWEKGDIMTKVDTGFPDQEGGLYKGLIESMDRGDLVTEFVESCERLRRLYKQRRELVLGGDPDGELETVCEDIATHEPAFLRTEARLRESLGDELLPTDFGRPGTVFHVQIGEKEFLVLLMGTTGNTRFIGSRVRPVSTEKPLGICLCGATKEEECVTYRGPEGVLECRILGMFSSMSKVPPHLLAGS